MVEYPVPGLRCVFCVYRLKTAIRKIDPGLEVKVDLRSGRVVVGCQDDLGTVERALAYLQALAPVG
jgi:copper chaperone CopZ